MSVVEQQARVRPRIALRDPRAVAAWCAALASAVLGVGQLLVASSMGVLTWQIDGRSGPADEAAVVIWLAAVAVSLGAVTPRLLVRLAPGRRMRFALPWVAAFGALLAAPIATAMASWAQMFGGELSPLRAFRLVFLGVVLGSLLAILAVRSRATAWSLLGWLAVGWILLFATSRSVPEASPTLGHLDPGPEWSSDSRMFQARLVLIVVAAGIGAGVGAAATVFNWGASRTWRATHRAGVPTPFWAAAAGPGLMLAAYAVAASTDEGFSFAHASGLLLATGVAAMAAYLGARLVRHAAPAV